MVKNYNLNNENTLNTNNMNIIIMYILTKSKREMQLLGNNPIYIKLRFLKTGQPKLPRKNMKDGQGDPITRDAEF